MIVIDLYTAFLIYLLIGLCSLLMVIRSSKFNADDYQDVLSNLGDVVVYVSLGWPLIVLKRIFDAPIWSANVLNLLRYWG